MRQRSSRLDRAADRERVREGAARTDGQTQAEEGGAGH